MKYLRVAACLAAMIGLTAPVGAQQTDPTNPDARVPFAQYRSVLHDYRYTPLPALGNWRELNDRAEKIGGPMGQLRNPDQPYRKRRRR
jgi:hypothetical protein